MMTLRPGLLALLLVAVACEEEALSAPIAERPAKLVRLPILGSTTDLVGLSGLTRDASGALWAVPERARFLVPVAVDGKGARVSGPLLPLVGVPADTDTEALAYLERDTFLLGTETMQPHRDSDTLFLARLAQGRVEVQSSFVMPYALWHTHGESNAGIEGLCHATGVILAGAEIVVGEHGARFAPIGRYDLAQKKWAAFRLRLSTATGKLSSLACRDTKEGLEALAIERHYGVARLLGFTVRRTATGGDLLPSWTVDLAPRVQGVPNMEGVEWLPDGSIVIVVDNDTGGVTGPNEVIVVRLD